MKNWKIKILIIFCLSLFASNQASAVDGCNWVKGNAINTPGLSGPNWSCPDSNTKEAEYYSSCEGKSPSLGSMCCCSKSVVVAPVEPKFKLPDYTFQIPIGDLSKLVPVDCSSGTCEVPFLAQYISAIYKYGLSIAGILGVLTMMAAGLLWMVSGGDSGKINKAKQLITGSVTGIILLVGLVMFLSFINPDLAGVKNISLPSIERIEIVPEQDADISIVGGVTVYKEGCAAARTGNLEVCKSLGTTIPVGLTTVSGKSGKVKVDSAVYQKYLAAMECVKAKNGGKDLFVINESFRDATTQLEYKIKYPDKSATPCCSNHSSGQAMDINKIGGPMSWAYNDSSGLTACMNAQGLYAKLTGSPNEPWHWSPTGK